MLIVPAHPYCACKFECHIIHRAHMLSTNMNNDRAGGHCYGFAWILRSWMFGDPYFSFQKQILFTIISTLSKNKQKIIVGSLKNFKISARRRETIVTKCELVVEEPQQLTKFA